MSTHPERALAAPGGVAEPDPELIALPSPPKGERRATVAIMVVTTIAALLLAWSLRGEARYATSDGQPQELGDLTQFDPTSAPDNRYVRGTGTLGTTGAIRYGRAAEGDTFRLAPVAGNEKLWVEIRVPEGFEGPRFIPPNAFAGRLVRMSSAGVRQWMLRSDVSEKTGVRIPDDAWLLIDSTSPRASRWALLLTVVLVAFAAWNVVGLVRILGRARGGPMPAPSDEEGRALS
ncbi:MAG: hypothetical protein U0414_00585 [Polyangiaceae bacterium]